MINFLNSPIMQDIITVLAVIATSYFHRKKPQIKQEVAAILPPQEAANLNDLLDTVDRLVQSSVSDANNRIVNGLKQNNIFTPDTAVAVKQSVIDNVMKNLGPLSSNDIHPDTMEWIVGQLIEKSVLQQKAF